MIDQQEKFRQFTALHECEAAFVIPNPWDAGTARLLASLGFAALATTSSGYAFAKGKRDTAASLSREEILENAAEIVAVTDLPVSADLEDGFGADPETCAETIRLAAGIGLVGGSIEDATGDPAAPIHAFDLAVDRIRAAAETIRRLQAFAEAGADVLYAPGLPDIEAIRTVCRSVDRPVNVVMGLSGPSYSVDELSQAGVRRISVGGSFARAALGAVMRAAEEVRSRGTFTYAEEALPGAEITRIMSAAERETRS